MAHPMGGDVVPAQHRFRNTGVNGQIIRLNIVLNHENKIERNVDKMLAS